MMRVLFLSMILAVNITLHAQQTIINPADPAFIAKYAKVDFGGKFAMVIEKDLANNYFLVDYSRLPSRFERVCFMNLTFSYKELVNIDPVINKSRVCFLVSTTYSEKEILKIFDQIKEDVLQKSGSWSDNQKAEWMKINDKYNK